MDTKYMKRALELSRKGSGFTNPNPLVGAVIVKNDKIIGEGYHERYGQAHAEINALKSAKNSVEGATMYVTLEPCSHYGKTPPCADAIIANGIKRVIVGILDPNPLVSGNGVRKLQEAGIEVQVGILESEIRNVNEIFLKYITTKKPFCIMKTAMTLDGKIATVTGDSKWITCTESREYVHMIRQRVASIMVGIGTVEVDNPLLTTRLNQETSSLTRIIVDSKLRINLESHVLNVSNRAKTIIATTNNADTYKMNILKRRGIEVIVCPTKKNRVDLNYLVNKLGEIGIDSILLEGGATLNYSSLNEGIVDKVMVFIGPKIFGGETAKTSVGGAGKNYVDESILLGDMNLKKIGSDILIEAYIKGSE
ncbi:bifunctional diaminohydroxyphosphoribosylaminopyrimidine deaminase/5-amino-6-(5-phosphoribosylamino)uracil reductase RibD [Mycoplasmatota bacterium]|nr:bifunctional diaminohydroxyphosphoribosylaminopyrimidine deaminase/5-amino-6-(5-phosphoribosylamino)uracil reductase RibD [Mycoplasmatota bacterium]